MKKFLLLVCIVFTAQLTKAQFHQDSIYFFMKLKNPKASFTINKPKMKENYSEYGWLFYVNTDNNQCTGDLYDGYYAHQSAPGKRYHGADYSISIRKTYRVVGDTTGPITVSLANKEHFELSIMRNFGPASYTSASNDLNYYFTGDSGIYIVANRNDTSLIGLDNNDDYFASTVFKLDSLTATIYDYNQVKTLSAANSDQQGDGALDVVELLGSRIYNANTGIAVNNTYISGTVKYDSSGAVQNLAKGKARFYSEGRGGDVTLVATMNISNGFFGGYAPVQGRYRILVVPDSAIYNIGILPTYYGNTVYWNSANVVDICRDSTLSLSVTLKRVNVNLTGPNSIQGYVLDGYGPRKPGEPKRGAGVALEQIPGGSVAYKTTDDNGFYDIQGLDPGVYKVTVNLPGKDMKAAYTTTLSAGTADVDTAVFFANDTLIYNEDTQLTIDSAYASFGTEKSISKDVSIYPNPNNGKMFVKYNAQPNEICVMTIYDLQGRNVFYIERVDKIQGERKQEINLQERGVKSGIFFLEIKQNDQINRSTFIIK